MKTIDELQDEVIEEFSDFDDWMDKYQLLIDLGNEQAPLSPEYKTDQNLIDGCQSRVWLQADLVDGKVEATFSLREKTELEKRLDAIEEGQSIQDGAIADLGEVVSTMAEGGAE